MDALNLNGLSVKNSQSQSNPNINHINIIEGLISKAAGHIEAISPQTATELACKEDAQKVVANFQKIELFKLRQVNNG